MLPWDESLRPVGACKILLCDLDGTYKFGQDLGRSGGGGFRQGRCDLGVGMLLGCGWDEHLEK